MVAVRRFYRLQLELPFNKEQSKLYPHLQLGMLRLGSAPAALDYGYYEKPSSIKLHR
jgi:hypothetical protein